MIRTRKRQRLRSHDYSRGGAYFVTVCTQERRCLFGQPTHPAILTEAGEIVLDVWEALPEHFLGLQLDECVVMPNHFHGVLWLPHEPVAGKKFTLGKVMNAFKGFSAREIRRAAPLEIETVWQRGYYENIVRREGDLERIRVYMRRNTMKWETDPDHPGNWKQWISGEP